MLFVIHGLLDNLFSFVDRRLSMLVNGIHNSLRKKVERLIVVISI